MSISSYRQVTYDGGILSAECLKSDGKTYVTSSISLDDYLGNVDGKFILGGKNFSQTAKNIGVYHGVLYANLKGPGNEFVDANIPLNDIITNNNGVLSAIVTGSLDVANAVTSSLGTALSIGTALSTAAVNGSLDVADAVTSSLGTALSMGTTLSTAAVNGSLDVAGALTSSLGTTLETAAVNGSINVPKAPKLEASLSTASSASAASSASEVSTASSTSTLATSVSSQSSSNYVQKGSINSTFQSSAFRSEQYLIQDTCSNLNYKDGFFHVDFKHSDGRVSHISIDLNLHIGNVDGQLQWGGTDFSKTCNSIHLEGFFLVANCLVLGQGGQKNYVTTRLDLRTHFRISGGAIIYVETNKKLSMMLSEVPWMKFKVVAEPDLSIFGSHQVVKETLATIAESTVKHVTIEMHKKLTIAMEEAIKVITASAIEYVSLQMEHAVRDAVGYVNASQSLTGLGNLSIGPQGLSYGAYGGYAAGGGYTAGGGYAAGGGYVGGANGAIQINGGAVGAVNSAQSNLVSTDSFSASQQAVSNSESYSSESKSAASTKIAQAESKLVSAQV